jgi:Tol biopolymer transport system component
VAIFGDVRSFDPDAYVDVQPGATLETGTLVISTGFEHYGSQWPTYTPDGSKIYSIFDKSYLLWVEANNHEPGLLGYQLPLSMPMSSDFLTWGPAAARASQFLYEGWQDSDTIFLGDANSGSSQLLVTIDPLRIGRSLLGLAWLPDGSGFLYSYNEMVNWVDKADLFVYSFATGQSTRLTNVPYGFIRRITVSPDGQKIVYEYQTYGMWYEENPAIDLWIMNRDGGQQALFVENARAPVWSKVAVPEPLVFDHHVFMPFVRKP